MKSASRTRESGEQRLIGCCGAYCKTCRSLILGSCRGCKLGYDEGKRHIARAKCKVKLCCFGDRHLETCSECPDFDDCIILADFHGKEGKDHASYRCSLEFIRANGYNEFIRRGKDWKRAYGELQG